MIVVFGFHTGISLPDGLLEWALWLLFVIVVLSGVIGAYLSWSIPSKLKQNSERMIFEGIPALRSELAREVDNLATHAANAGLTAQRPFPSGICCNCPSLQDGLVPVDPVLLC